MPNTPRSRPLKTGDLAKEFQVTANTVRTWSKQYAPWLSDSAQPADPMQERKYTQRDLMVLREVRKLRGQRRLHEEIADALNEMVFPDVVDPNAQEIASESVDTPPQQAQARPERDAPQLPALVVDLLRQEIAAVRQESAQATRQQRDRVTVFLYGALAGLIAGVLLFWLAYALLALSVR